MKQILFIRHGSTAGNLEKRYIGRTDEPLCDTGIQQILTLQQHHFKPDVLFVSPMLRTRQTAELLFPHMIPQIVEDFRETDFGIFEGKTADELRGCSEYQTWVDSLCLDPIPDGEAVADFKTRCCKAFEKISDTLPEDCCAAFVVHGGVIMAIMEQFDSRKLSFYDYHIGNGNFLSAVWKNDTLISE